MRSLKFMIAVSLVLGSFYILFCSFEMKLENKLRYSINASNQETLGQEKVKSKGFTQDERLPTIISRKRDTGESVPDDKSLFVPAAKDVSNEEAFKKEMLKYKDKIYHHCALKNAHKNEPAHDVNTPCNGSQRVPSIVHFVWLWDAPETYKFRQLLGGLSVLRVVKPCAIYFWNAGFLPTGKYWDTFVENATASNTRLYLLNITTPLKFTGKKFIFEAHKSDIVRIYAIQYFGGIYMDFDIIALNSFSPLLCYDMVGLLGRQGKKGAGLPNALMIAVPNATFIQLWITKYRKNFKPTVWAYNSVSVPRAIYNQNESLVHVEETTIHVPHFRQLDTIFKKHYNWRHQYAIHLWNNIPASKRRNKYENPTSIKTMNSAFGEIARWVYYGIEPKDWK